MTVSQPWWAAPLFTLLGTSVGVVLTQGGNLISDRLRRKAERAERWDKDKVRDYLDYQRAARELIHLRVWSVEPTGLPDPIEPVLTTLFDRNENLTALTHGRVSDAANDVAAAAHRLTKVITEIRDSGHRGPAGIVPGDAANHWAASRRELAESLRQFTLSWRQDLGITAPYTAGLDADGSVLAPTD